MSSPNEAQRDLKRPYRKRAFQTGYTQSGEAVAAYPPPPSSYGTTERAGTKVIRPGQDPATFDRQVRPAVEYADRSKLLDFATYPWHLVPKPNSANVTIRQLYNFATAAAYNLANGEYIDALVLNVSDTYGANSWTDLSGNGIFQPTPTAFTGEAPAPQVRALPGFEERPVTAATNNRANSGTPFATDTVTATSPTIGRTINTTAGNKGDYYHIASFGHTEASTIAGIRYQLWIDGQLYQEWGDFQWSAIIPKIDQWHFDIPLVVTQQIVFRVLNDSAGPLTTGSVEGCFAGWTEQRDYYQDVGREQSTNVGASPS